MTPGSWVRPTRRPSEVTETPSWLRAASIPLMLGAGALVAIQARINGELAGRLGDGTRAGALAATISFGSGLVVLTVLVIGRPSVRRGIGDIRGALRTHRIRPYELLGGLGGAFFVATQGITVGTIGVALFIVAFTAGQSASSLLVDHLGWSPHGRHAIAPARVVAALLAVVAVVLTAGERLVSDADTLLVFFASLAFVAGTLQAIQQALNGRVAAVGGSWATTWNNFLVGTAGLLVLLAISFAADGRIGSLPHTWWLYLGGTCGIGFIWVASWTVRLHGVLVLGLCMIAGQVVTAELLDVASEDSHIGVVGVAGGALTLLGVLIALLSRRTAARTDLV